MSRKEEHGRGGGGTANDKKNADGVSRERERKILLLFDRETRIKCGKKSQTVGGTK